MSQKPSKKLVDALLKKVTDLTAELENERSGRVAWERRAAERDRDRLAAVNEARDRVRQVDDVKEALTREVRRTRDRDETIVQLSLRLAAYGDPNATTKAGG